MNHAQATFSMPNFNVEVSHEPAIIRRYNQQGQLLQEINLGHWCKGLSTHIKPFVAQPPEFGVPEVKVLAISEEAEIDRLAVDWKAVSFGCSEMRKMLPALPPRFRPSVERCLMIHARIRRSMGQLSDLLMGAPWTVLDEPLTRRFTTCALRIWRLTDSFERAVQVVFCNYTDRRRRLSDGARKALGDILHEFLTPMMNFGHWTRGLRRDALYADATWN